MTLIIACVARDISQAAQSHLDLLDEIRCAAIRIAEALERKNGAE